MKAEHALASAAAVRERCTAMLAVAERSGLTHFTVHTDRLGAVADYVADGILVAYPTLDIPHHARWRHFSVGGVDRWALLRRLLPNQDADAVARVRVELCIVSVLLDAGAGPAWRYAEAATGLALGRSEGLGVASFDAFRAGLFSLDGRPGVDAGALSALMPGALAAAFQDGPGNPLVGVAGRAALLRRLGDTIATHPALFPGGLGGLYDTVLAAGRPVRATAILSVLLQALGPIWPSGRGDVWPHPAVPGDGLIPFHKLSQWLAYSLIEVFEDAGHPVVDIGELTGLPEYRNGGLFLDMGVLQLRDPALAATLFAPGHEAVVEWRALTVALLDRLAPMVRARLGRDEAALPLSRILEGGTWAAGRAIAAERRAGGGPPLQVESDGTVF